MLIEKVRQRTFLYDTKTPHYRDQHMRANAWGGIGKELKIKLKFYVSSRDVRIVFLRLNGRALAVKCALAEMFAAYIEIARGFGNRFGCHP